MFWEMADPKIQIEYYIIACFFAVLIVVLGRRKRNIAAKAALVVYMFLVVASTVLCRPTAAERVVLIVPGWSIVKVIQTGSWGLAIEILLNALMLLPIGVLIPLAFENADGWDVLLTAMAFSVLIESAQLIFLRGWFEVDDIINNTFGAVIGWLPVYGIRKARKQ